MTRFRTLALFVTMLVVYAAENITLDAQTKAPAKQSASIAVSVSPRKDSLALDEKPWAILTVKNISNRDVSLRTDMLDYHVHVEGEKGEPPKTAYHRRVRGEFQPGDTDLAGGGPVDRIPPGGSEVQKYDLSAFYDLKVPGKYAVYIEVQDHLNKQGTSGLEPPRAAHWLRWRFERWIAPASRWNTRRNIYRQRDL